MGPTPLWSFPPFRLDPSTASLWRDEQLVPLPPKPYAVLAYLVVHAGDVVSKAQLLKAVWPETAVTEGVLKRCILQIRQVLSDTAAAPQYVVTVHRRGYRFIAPVTPLAVVPTPVASPAAPPPSGPALLAALAPSAPGPLLVGRETALIHLQQCWEQACQGQRQIIFITGEAGIGKTTLVDAFVARLAAIARVWIGHGQCLEHYSVGEPYLPLLEAFGRLGRGPQGTPVLAALRRRAPSWLVHLPVLLSEADIEAVQRRLGSVTRERMLRELAEAVEALTAVQPLVLVLEDLHWSDGATLDWLSYVARRRDRAALLVLSTYRPGDAMVHANPVHTIAADLTLHGQGREVALDYLSAAGVVAYLRQRCGEAAMPVGLAQALHQRTTGNPLFLTAVVDDLMQRAVLRQGLAGWDLMGGLEAVTAGVPENLWKLLMQQLEQLSLEDQALLEAASLVGEECAAPLVAAGLDSSVDDVEVRCAALARRSQFLQLRGTVVWPDGTIAMRFGFRHTLYRTSLYDRVPPGRRARGHRQIGLCLEAAYMAQTQAIAVELAEYFLRGRDFERAVLYLRQAGEQAVARSAHREAVRHYEQAIESLQELPQTTATRAATIDLHLAVRTALIPLGDSAGIVTHMRAAEALATHLGDVGLQGRIAAYWARDLGTAGHHAEAIAWGQRALTLLQDNVTLHMTTQLYLSYAYYYRGEYRAAVAIMHEALGSLPVLPAGARLGAAVPAAVLHHSLVQAIAELGQFDEGIAYGQKALNAAELARHPFSLYQACRSLGSLYLCQGELDHATSLLERARTICQEADLPYGIPYTVSCLGWAYAQAGHREEAQACLAQGRQAVASQRSDRHASRMRLFWSESYMVLGCLATAMPLAREALAMARERKEHGFEAYALYLLGVIAAQEAAPDLSQAIRYAHQAMALAQELGMRPLMAHLHYQLGTCYSRRAQSAQAAAALSTAVDLYRTMAMTFWLAPAERALARTAYGP